MENWRFRAHLLFGCTYFLIAAAALSLTRLDGGVAFIWAGSALLLAKLNSTDTGQWPGYLVACAVASMLATGLFGLGWGAAPVFAGVNVAEPLLGAVILARWSQRYGSGSVVWLKGYLVASVLPPAITSLVVAVVTYVGFGREPLSILMHWFVGHSLGLLTFMPLFVDLFRGHFGDRLRGSLPAKPAATYGQVALMAAVTIATFAQSQLPLLFLPVLPLVMMTYRLGEAGVTLGMALLIVIGTAATALGHGPIMLLDAPILSDLQFLQLYLAAAVLTVLPLAAALSGRDAVHLELSQSEARYRLLSDHSTDVIASLDLLGNFQFVSPSIEQNSGHNPHDMIGTSPLSIIDPAFHDAVRKAHYDTLKGAGAMVRVEYLVNTVPGAQRWFETHERAVLDNTGKPTGIVAFIRDIHDRKATEARLVLEARTDPLTGAANRRTLIEAVDQAVAKEGKGALIVFDLDHFKSINDRHGHAGGDLTLRTFVQTALDVIRANDIIARVGGEEFVLYLPDATPEQAGKIGTRVIEAFAEQFIAHEEGYIRATASAGVAVLEGSCAETMRRADAALYRAKCGGRDQLQIAA